MRTPPRAIRTLAAFTLLAALAPSLAAAQHERRVTQLAPGVHVIEHKDDPDGNESGNTTVVIGDRDVLVVDGGQSPAVAREDIAEIRRLTDKPVRWVVTTHFHDDHNNGNRAYAQAFPTATFVAQAETKIDMDRYSPRKVAQYTPRAARLQQVLDSGRTPNGHVLTADERNEVRAALASVRTLLADLAAIPYTPPNLAFHDALDIDLGGRSVRLLWLGRGNTAGDAVVFLPRERIAAIGDLVVDPIPYVYDGYPSEWGATLQRVIDLDADTYVPGHGPLQRDKSRLVLTRDLMREATTQLNAALAKVGPALFRTLDEITPLVDLSSFRTKFTRGDAALDPAFSAMTQNLVKVAFREASIR